jgi:hypothetical protein
VPGRNRRLVGAADRGAIASGLTEVIASAASATARN